MTKSRGLFCFIVFLAFTGILFAGGNENADFSVEHNVESTPVKDQYKTNTCWSFSSISFLESELMRKGKGIHDLSEMFIVRYTYAQKAEKYIRMHGSINFAGGGAANDATDVIKRYGIVPESIYNGKQVDPDNHIHFEMDKVLKEYVDAIVENPNKKLSPVWYDGFMQIIDSYLGKVPMEFDYNGNTYTPESYAKELEINPDDYILLTSFNHHPYYNPFIIEVPDNWSWGQAYNLPLDEFSQTVDHALANEFSMVWAADVSEDGFNFKKGLAVAPEILYTAPIAEKKEWKKKEKEEQEALIFNKDSLLKEVDVTQELRQQGFDNYSTTDDHAMHLVGLANGQNGEKFYYVKNSWGTDNPYDGYFYASEAYFKYKTLSVMLHKDALPKEIRKKLNL